MLSQARTAAGMTGSLMAMTAAANLYDLAFFAVMFGWLAFHSAIVTVYQLCRSG